MIPLKCEVCGSEENVIVSTSVLGHGMAVAYCGRCRHDDLATWNEIVGAVYISGFDHLAPWADRIITRSMIFHGKKKSDVLDEINRMDAELEAMQLEESS